MTMTNEEGPNSAAWLAALARQFTGSAAVGWINPNGSIMKTELHYHLQHFIDNDWECPEVYAFLKPYWDDFLEPRMDAHRASGRRWHEWVDIPMSVEDEVAQEAKSMAYAAGWGRIGVFGSEHMELECFEEHRRKLTKHVKEFAEVLGRTLQVNVVTHERVPPPAAPGRF